MPLGEIALVTWTLVLLILDPNIENVKIRVSGSEGFTLTSLQVPS